LPKFHALQCHKRFKLESRHFVLVYDNVRLGIKFEIFAVLKVYVVVFCIMTPSSLLGGYQKIENMTSSYSTLRMKALCFSEALIPDIKLRVIKIHKTQVVKWSR
jgi:hypothetical protein